MEFSLPKNILYIISIINDFGYTAHIVGGCVRDLLVNRVPNDWDITTNASPEIIKSLFQKTYDTGIRHGTVTILLDDMPYEITTWRKESAYSDHRRPDYVYCADSLKEDLARRDFTMNAIAYHPREGLIDPFNGYDDIKKGIIRCVGNPYERFSEDALRMLRAIRFSAQLGFNIENNTKAAIEMLFDNLSYISKERVQAELNKILESSSPEKLKLLWDTGLNRIIFPEISDFPDSWYDSIKYLLGEKNQKEILLTLFFYEVFASNAFVYEGNALAYAGNAKACASNAQAYAVSYLRAYKYDNKTSELIKNNIKCLNNIGSLTRRNIIKSVTEYGMDITMNTIKIMSARKSIPSIDNDVFLASLLSEVSPIVPEVSGADMNGLGLEGRNIKDMLDILSHCLYERPELNEYDTLMILANKVICTNFT